MPNYSVCGTEFEKIKTIEDRIRCGTSEEVNGNPISEYSRVDKTQCHPFSLLWNNLYFQ